MLSRSLVIFCTVVLLSVRLFAQTSGAIVGTVQDASGAAVAGAIVSVLDVGKGTTQVFKTDDSGAYSAPFLIPGTYRISVEAPGFKRATSQDIVLQVDERQRADFTMQIGQASETVEVVAAAPLVRSESAELGEVIGQGAVQSLPLNGRNFAQLVYLVPGVTPGQQGENLSGSSTFNPRASSNFNALGSQANANGWLVDGIIDNEYTFNTVMVQPSVESVQEFKVLTGTFSAEYGRGAGIVTTQTRSGSNDFHGSAFEFLRNNYFDARNYFNSKTTGNGNPNPQPPFRRNQYGASIGGLIFKNKTFFFADYYGQREIKGNTFLTTVPTAQQHAGNFSDLGVNIYDPLTATTTGGARSLFPNNTIPANRIDPVAQRIIDLYPLPNLNGINNNRLDVFNRDLKDNGGNVRIDQHFSDKDSFFARYSYEAFDLFDAKGQSGCCYQTPASAAGKYDLGPFVSGGQITTLRASGLALNETHVFSPTIVNEFIAGYSRTNPLTTQSDFGHQAATSLGINGINLTPFTTGLPTIVPSAAGNQANVQALNGGPGFLPAHPVQTSYQIQDGVSWTVGVHQMSFGYRIIQNRVSPFTNSDTRGTLNFGLNFTDDPLTSKGGSGFATLLLGHLTSGSRGFLLSPYYLTNYEHSAWFQDNWKVSPRLTLNLGLRWEVFTAATEQQNRLTNFDLANLRLVYAGVNTSDTAGLQTRWNNFGPRFVFAYNADGKGTTVLRGGFGMSYFP
ncbi:MAG: TonB-dependent receptor, partial [Acidobacteriaceae bacterium]|nr:TonB-dependent receptor [Acidobacteriaceae bacterium]